MSDTQTDPVEAFYAKVNERAENDMLAGNPVTGAHHRALERTIAEYRKAQQLRSLTERTERREG